MFKSIVVSCDIYYYGLAMDLGMDRIANYMTRFGFGKKTGIDLGRKTEDGYEGESSGLVPTPAWKYKRYKQRWYGGDTVPIGIGQGYTLVTPLQLASATATLANNGVGYQPHLVREIRGARPEDSRRINPPPNIDLKINPTHIDLIKRAMIAVTQPGGTAVAASAGAPYPIAAKTGTAQVIGMKQGEKYNAGRLQERHRDHAWLIAFAPADQPRIAVAILAENGGHGGGTAGPMARKLFDYYLLGKLPPPAVPVPPDQVAPRPTSAVNPVLVPLVIPEEEHD
jgi:penicillin-binding protein 2